MTPWNYTNISEIYQKLLVIIRESPSKSQPLVSFRWKGIFNRKIDRWPGIKGKSTPRKGRDRHLWRLKILLVLPEANCPSTVVSLSLSFSSNPFMNMPFEHSNSLLRYSISGKMKYFIFKTFQIKQNFDFSSFHKKMFIFLTFDF